MIHFSYIYSHPHPHQLPFWVHVKRNNHGPGGGILLSPSHKFVPGVPSLTELTSLSELTGSSWTFMWDNGKNGRQEGFYWTMMHDLVLFDYLNIYFLCVPTCYLWGKPYQRLPGNGPSAGEEWLTVRHATQALYYAKTSFKLSVWKSGMGKYRVK